MSDYDVIIIGAGPGGYVAAIRAAQLGLRTACVERDALGGICLNWGCIPTKALLRSAEVLELAQRAAEFGVMVEGVTHDFSAMIKRSRDIAARISKGVAFLFRKNQIDHIAGTAKLAGAGRIEVARPDGTSQSLTAEHLIVATGGRARPLPGVDHDGERIIHYREAMSLATQPRSLVIIGAGAIGVEFASFYRSLGTAVDIVEYLPRVVPLEDEDISAELARAFRKRGIGLHTGKQVTGARIDGDQVVVGYQDRDDPAKRHELRADVCLVAIGIVGNTEDLGLEDIGVAVERSFIAVDADRRTAVRNVWAIGDVIGAPALAHTASAEGVHVAELIAGRSPRPLPFDAIPACTYCHPEIASVGLTEAAARAQGLDIKVGKFPFRPLGKTMAAGEYPGLVKVIWNASDHSLVGAHMIGPAVTDLIAEPTLAKTTEVNAESLIHTIHAHPTFAEALKEAAEDALGHAIHL